MSPHKYIYLALVTCSLAIGCFHKEQTQDYAFISKAQRTIAYLQTDSIFLAFVKRHTEDKAFKYVTSVYSIDPILESLKDSFSQNFLDSLDQHFKPVKNSAVSSLYNSWFPDYVFFFTPLPDDKIYCQIFLNLKTYFPINRDGSAYMGQSITCIISFEEDNRIKDIKVEKVHYS